MKCSPSVLSSPRKCANPAHARKEAAKQIATTARLCAHSVITIEKSPVFARVSSLLADSQSVHLEVSA